MGRGAAVPRGSRGLSRSHNLRAWDEHLGGLRLRGAGTGIPEAWFLGPRAENEDLLTAMIAEAIREHARYRLSYHPEDPPHIHAGDQAL